MAEKSRKIGIVTELGKSPYPDDILLKDKLIEENHKTEIVTWRDDNVAWEDFDILIIRSTWDYHPRHKEFINWVNMTRESGITLLNDAKTVLWNINKGKYLKQLQERGITLIPSAFYDGNDKKEFEEIAKKARDDWGKIVVKPFISAGGDNTFIFDPKKSEKIEGLLGNGIIIQKFMPEISGGEHSLIFIGGEYSHALLRKPPVFSEDNKMKVEEINENDIPNRMMEFAKNILDKMDHPTIYARVDILYLEEKPAERFMLMELELIEPDFYLHEIKDKEKQNQILQRFAQIIIQS